jgi:hypothetical protein
MYYFHQLIYIYQEPINHMHFSPDGSNLITSSDDDQVTLIFLKSR